MTDHSPPTPGGTDDSSDDEMRLPLRKRYAVLAGAAFGVALRLAFGGPTGSSWSAMSAPFILGAPFAVGMLTVYLAERQQRRTWLYYLLAPLFATALFVAGTLLILIEGAICALVIIPLFSAIGIVGGLTMGVVCRLTRWPAPFVSAAIALPLLAAALGMEPSTVDRNDAIERSIDIGAPPDVVWQTLNRVDSIRPDEMADAWTMRIGVPAPMSGLTRQTPEGLVRESRWGKSVHFDELIVDWQPERFVRWTYRFAADSFPKHALDEHVVLGGPHFDLLDTSFSLVATSGGTRLTTRVRYRVSTQFNFYAAPVARFLLGNLSETGLRMYRSRAEQEQRRQGVGPVAGR